MKSVLAVALLALFVTGVSGAGAKLGAAAGHRSGSSSKAHADPIAKVITLLERLSEQLKRDAKASKEAFDQYTAWCGTVARNTGAEIERASAQKAKLEAKINELRSDIDLCTSKIEDLAKSVSTSNAELANATALRQKESADFVAGEEELLNVIETLNKAADMLDREMKKDPTVLAQIDKSNVNKMLMSLTAVVSAAAVSNGDPQELLALAQDGTQDGTGDDSDGEAPPNPTAEGVSRSGDIIAVLKDLRQKAESQLGKLRAAETKNKQTYAKLKFALETQSASDAKDMTQQKATRAQAQEVRARAEHELEVAVNELKSASKTLETTRITCMRVAKDHEASVKARAEELKVLAQATDTLQATTGNAAKQTYASFVQVSSVSSVNHPVAATAVPAEAQKHPATAPSVALVQVTEGRRRLRLDPTAAQVVSMVDHLSKEHQSPALAQLASRLMAAARYGAAGGEDPLKKIKQMVRDMIGKLEKEQKGDGTEKAYCDVEMPKTEGKRRELFDKINQLTAKLDQSAAHSAGLKEQVSQLQSELANLAREQADLNRIRQEDRANYLKAKGDLQQGLNGVRQALTVLRDYYANNDNKESLLQEGDSSDSGDAADTGDGSTLDGSESADSSSREDAEFSALMQQPAAPSNHAKQGAGGAIISLLEMIESDFATNLAKIELEETDAQGSYDRVTQENKVARATKEKDAVYRMQTSKSIDKSISEIAADRETLNSELAAVQDYAAKLRDRCVGKPETFQETKARRQEEIRGLEEALNFLKSTSVSLAQRQLRGHGGHTGALEPDDM